MQDIIALQRALAQTQHRDATELNRLVHELEFADKLVKLHPTRGARWRKLRQRALSGVQASMVGGDRSRLREAVREAERVLAPIGRIAKTYTMHCVGHAHIDMNWMWSWPETVAVTHDTFGTVLRLMDDYPTFMFSQSQISTYQLIARHNPQMAAAIKRRIKEGRWEVTASHWVEGDKNLVGGESLCRHLLYARRYAREVFGLAPEDVPVDFAPDTFGHAASVPTYLHRGGVKYCYLHRPGIYTSPKAPAFWWQGPDGSRVLVKNDMAIAYNGQITHGLGEYLLQFAGETGAHAGLFVYGVGDHGGGPTRYDLDQALEMDRWPIFPNIKFSTLRAFFESFAEESPNVPTVVGELNTEFTGCYTTQSLIKKCSRYGECKLVDAETAAVLNWAAMGFDYPADLLREGWQDTLFSHFHDILPGSCVHDSRTYTHGLFQKTMATTSMVETQALRLLASQVDTSTASDAPANGDLSARTGDAEGVGVGFGSGNGLLSCAAQSTGGGSWPFLVFNPLSQERAEVVEAAVWDNGRRTAGVSEPLSQRSWAVRPPDGTTIAAQVTDSGNYWGHQYVKLAFPVRVPSLGYAVYTVVEKSVTPDPPTVRHIGYEHHCRYSLNEGSKEGLENAHIRLELDPTNGGIRSLIDKARQLPLIQCDHPEPLLEYILERPHRMSAWTIAPGQPGPVPRLVALGRKHLGPHSASIELKYQIAESSMTVVFELRHGDPCVYIHLQGIWFQRGTAEGGFPLLRARFPLALSNAKARYEIPFGAIDRPFNQGEELPALQWAQVALCAKRTLGSSSSDARSCVQWRHTLVQRYIT